MYWTIDTQRTKGAGLSMGTQGARLDVFHNGATLEFFPMMGTPKKVLVAWPVRPYLGTLQTWVVQPLLILLIDSF